jgi:hypothetical protein
MLGQCTTIHYVNQETSTGPVFLSGPQIRPARPQNLRPALAQAMPRLYLNSLRRKKPAGQPGHHSRPQIRPAGLGRLGKLN